MIEKLRRFALLLLSWNASVSNLISRNDEPRIVARHFSESLMPARWLAQSGAQRWIDFGSGAGFPAIPLAVAGVGREWTLVESRRPKVLFMRKALIDLRLESIDVVHSRLESLLDPALGPRFDAFTSRATLRLGPTLQLAAQMVVPGGRAFLWKGSRLEEEMAQDSGWSKFWIPERVVGVGGDGASVSILIRK